MYINKDVQNVYRSFILDGSNLVTTTMSTNKEMKKKQQQIIVYPYNRILLAHKRNELP